MPNRIIMTRQEILTTIRTADPGTGEMLAAVERQIRLDWLGMDNGLGAAVDDALARREEEVIAASSRRTIDDKARNVPRVAAHHKAVWSIPVVTRESDWKEGEAA